LAALLRIRINGLPLEDLDINTLSEKWLANHRLSSNSFDIWYLLYFTVLIKFYFIEPEEDKLEEENPEVVPKKPRLGTDDD